VNSWMTDRLDTEQRWMVAACENRLTFAEVASLAMRMLVTEMNLTLDTSLLPEMGDVTPYLER
jgi:hypothetical protein